MTAIPLVSTTTRRRRSGLAASVSGTIGAVLVGLILLLTVLAPLLAPSSPNEQDIVHGFAHPSFGWNGLMGTDGLGRSMLSRVLYGGRMPILIVAIAVLVATAVGVMLALVSAYAAGPIDVVLSRLAEIQLALPAMLLALVFLAFGGTSTSHLVVILALAMWPIQYRLIRAQAMMLAKQPYVEASRMLGGRAWSAIWHHLLPGVMPVAIVNATQAFSTGLIIEASLSYLGVGVRPPTPDWGQMIAAGQSQLSGAWWLAMFPAGALLLLLVGVQTLGDWAAHRWSLSGLAAATGDA